MQVFICVENGRSNSIGNESTCTELSVDLKRLEEVRGSLTDTPSSVHNNTGWNSTNNDSCVLHSPSVSPEMWAEVPSVVVNAEKGHDEQDHSDKRLSMSWNTNFLSVPRKPSRRLSSGSLNSGSDESDHEISPPVARRGRRAAIVDTKNFGDVSPTTLSPEVSPSNSCDEGETGSNIAGRLRRRRSSHDVSMNVYPGDLLVQEHHKKLIKRNTISDFYAARNGPIGSMSATADDSKKQRQPFSLLKLMKTRSKESLHLSDVLKDLKASEFKDNHLAAYKNVHWTDLIACRDKQNSATDSLNISEMERKRRESVWELFKSECVFLIDHLMVLKHCFLEPLKKVQVEGFLMYTEPSEIFSNLDELCYVSYTFCKDFIASLLKDMRVTDFGSTTVLIKAFQRFSNHSKDGSVYHTYCLNYTNALSYLEKLRKNDDFCEFEKWCEQDQRCNRLQLADLLIGPMQHCTKLPLLLHNIQKYTEDIVEKKQIVESIEKVEMSLRQLEEKMKWLKNFERVQDIQRHLVWPSITDLDSRAFIPEYLKPKLTRQPCERLLACPSRQLIHEGAVTLTESTKSFDAYMFLFDDILLITKTKKPNRKKQSSSDINNTTGQPDNQMYTVHRQPIALDRLGVHDVMPSEATANGLKCAFVIVQISRFQQIIDVFTIQAQNEASKGLWISQILDVKSRIAVRCNSRGSSLKESEDSSPTTGSVRRGRHGKSLSIDAVFL
ncbi:prolactin receptor [Mactra antiquata]